MKTSINVGLMWLGTVGTGVMKILPEVNPLLYDKFGVKLEVKKILDREPDRPRSITVEKDKLTTDPSDILSDPDIDIVIELLGGEHPAKEYILELILLTHKVKYKNILDAVELAQDSGAVTKILNFISIEDDI